MLEKQKSSMLLYNGHDVTKDRWHWAQIEIKEDVLFNVLVILDLVYNELVLLNVLVILDFLYRAQMAALIRT